MLTFLVPISYVDSLAILLYKLKCTQACDRPNIYIPIFILIFHIFSILISYSNFHFCVCTYVFTAQLIFSAFFVLQNVPCNMYMHHVHVTVPVPPFRLPQDIPSDTSPDISWSDQMSKKESYTFIYFYFQINSIM